MRPEPLYETEETPLVPFTELKRPSNFAVTSCSITLAKASGQRYLTDKPGNDREGVKCTFSNRSKLAPTIINRMKMIRMENEESWYLEDRVKGV